MPLSEGFIALPIVYLVRLDELYANVWFRDSALTEKSAKFTWLCYTNRLFMKLFRTTGIRIISICQELFNFELPSVQLERSCKKNRE